MLIAAGGAAAGLGAVFARTGLLGPALAIGAVGLAGAVATVFARPRIGLWATLVIAVIGLGVKRYIPAPMGLAVDGLLALTWIAVVIPAARTVDWAKLNRPVVWATAAWMGYITLQLINPEAPSRLAWAYAMRGVALYMMLTIPLILLLADRKRDLDLFLLIWFVLSVLGTLNGLRQKLIGVDPFEQHWLNQGAAVQHVLFGKLRVFSFYSDAGQAGAAQGHVATVAGILALGPQTSWKRRLAYAATAAFGLVGLFISGTRGAMAVPFLGGITYLILSKNGRAVATGALAMAAVYAVLMYTSLGASVYEIQRVRAALQRGSDTPSMRVRLENQRRLARYMSADPLRYLVGGGVGSVGSWGRRFSPGTFLADFPPDSWYVRIWAETGTAGLVLHLGLWIFLLGRAAVVIWHLRDPDVRQKMIALHAGIMGILLASYGNQVLGQMPTGLIVYASLAYVSLAPSLAASASRGEGSEGTSAAALAPPAGRPSASAPRTADAV
jgi:ABC-type multidrug transport system fused ATPase/permease subunit